MKRPLNEVEIWEKVREAQERGDPDSQIEPRAVRVWHDAEKNLIMFEMRNGCVFGFPPRYGYNLETASGEQLAKAEVIGGGEGLGWDELDAHISVPGIMFDLLNVRAWHARWLGGATSEAKAAAARENGKKGGRPRTKAPAAKRSGRNRATGGD